VPAQRAGAMEISAKKNTTGFADLDGARRRCAIGGD
jgi:hypothetical protein